MKQNAEDVQSDRQNQEGEYDPFANRPSASLASDFAAFMHLLKCAIGTGILFLPNAFRRTGYVMSIVCGIVIGALCTHMAIIVVQCSQALCRRNRVPMLDFAETAQFSFQTGPERIRKYARLFGVVTNVIICFVHFQAAVIYILYVATSFQQVIEFFSGFEMNSRIYIVIFLPFTSALGFVPNLKYLAPFSVIGTLFLFLGICIALYYFLIDFPSDPHRLNALTEVLPVPMYCAIFLFALHNMTLFLPLENSMKHPDHMPRIIVMNTLLNTAIYLAFGFFGYNKYPDACDTVIKNLPMEETLECGAYNITVEGTSSIFLDQCLRNALHDEITPLVTWKQKRQPMMRNCTMV